MPHSVNVSGLNKFEIYEAVLQALLANTNTGGGGGGTSVPSVTTLLSGSGSYTVPTGYYAKVKAQCHAGGSVSFNSQVVMSSSDVTWSAMISNVSPKTYYHNTNPLTYKMGAGEAGGSILGDTFSNSTARNRTSANNEFNLKAGVVISVNANAYAWIELYLL